MDHRDKCKYKDGTFCLFAWNVCQLWSLNSLKQNNPKYLIYVSESSYYKFSGKCINFCFLISRTFTVYSIFDFSIDSI